MPAARTYRLTVQVLLKGDTEMQRISCQAALEHVLSRLKDGMIQRGLYLIQDDDGNIRGVFDYAERRKSKKRVLLAPKEYRYGMERNWT